MRLVSRAEWNARPPKNRSLLNKGSQEGTAIHYSASDADEQSQHTNCAGRVRSIQVFHMDTRGWADIAYNYLVCKHGYTFEGRGLGVRSAGQGTDAGNTAYHAVCFLGDDTPNRDDVTPDGRQALLETTLMTNGWSNATRVRPHSSFKATECPGDDLRTWISQVGARWPAETEDALPFTEEELRRIIAEEITRILRIAVGPDDASVPAGNYFGRVESKLDTVIDQTK